jgi:branched-chain amino acid transport system ATP-binding protein
LEKRNEPVIEVREIQTYYGESHIIQGLSLYVGKGESVSILGRNGVGKTTTLRSIMGLTPKLAERPLPEGGGWTFERVYEYFDVLKYRRKQDGSTLSGGEQQMLAIGRGLMGNPRIMLLDEPSQGLSPLMVRAVRDIIRNLLADHGLTLLLVEQNFRLTLKLAERHYLMGVKGKIEHMATTKELLENEEIIKRHLAV